MSKQIIYLINRTFCLSALSCLLFTTLTASAEQVEARLPGGITSTANLHTGLATRPAVLVLHGFLQTWHSPPMSSLASNIASRGYTVLSPTMSLNINQRSQSMACDAVHTHTLEGEVAEVAYWINWLNNRGFKDIVLIGFSSTGNIAALVASTQKAHPSIKKVILTSLNPLSSDPKEYQKTLSSVKASPKKNDKKLEHFSLGYCKKNFTSTNSNYLSYAAYDDHKVLELLKETTVHTELILGTVDTILPANWLTKIKAINANIRITSVKNANHFFDDTHEFDLAEAVESILKNIPSRNL